MTEVEAIAEALIKSLTNTNEKRAIWNTAIEQAAMIVAVFPLDAGKTHEEKLACQQLTIYAKNAIRALKK